MRKKAYLESKIEELEPEVSGFGGMLDRSKHRCHYKLEVFGGRNKKQYEGIPKAV